MPRVARVIAPDFPHHVTQRGNRRAAIFNDESDRYVYLSLLRQNAQKHGVRIWAYALMPNHVHLVAVPATVSSMGAALRNTHGAHALYFNRKHGAAGHLWQGRYFSCVLDHFHFWAAVRYVERNPVRAGLVARAEDYPWSSAAAHCDLRQDLLLSGDLPAAVGIRNWSAWLSGRDERAEESIRKATAVGRPCGSDEFLIVLEKRLARRLRPARPGRKPQNGD
jgi:REP-associated tyrosine transposase